MPKKSLKKNTDRTGRTAIGLDALARRAGNRLRRPVLIVCEGKQTEQRYFNALRMHYRLATVDVSIYGEGAGPLEVVQRAVERIAERRQYARRHHDAPPPYEEAWCVFDREAANEPGGYRAALQLAANHKIRLAISNPAFEYWYLLHFIETSRAFQNADEVLTELCKPGCVPGYQKSQDVFPLLRDRTSAAYDRAERLYSRHPDREQDPYPNPSTLVHQLVAGMLAMASFRD